MAQSPKAAATDSEVVCFCVSDPSAVRAVVTGDDGALTSASPGAVFVDLSTVDPATSREMAELCGRAGLRYLDAPVSGGVVGAVSGKLTVMIGGDAEAVATARPVLEAMGEKIAHVGPSGAGSTVKLINQILVGVNLAAVLEAFVTAKVAGVDPQTLFDVLAGSAGSSKMLTRCVPDYILKRDFEPGFALKLLCKDLGLALEMGSSCHTQLLTPAVAHQIFQVALAADLGDDDMSAAILPLEKQHGIELRGSEA